MKSAFTFGSITMISRILGFVRDMLIASFLGAGMVTDAFFMAFRFPNLFRVLFAEGGATAAFVPIFAARLEKGETRQANHFASEAVSSLLYVTFLATAVLVIFMPWVAMAFAPGFIGNAEKFDLTVLLTRIIMPFLIFASVEAILAGMMNAKGKFAAGAAMPIILNLMMMLGLFTIFL
ncbi:MAG: lipid II flippase MurJ, partial [Alphaproteobacteria bacterium]|nr:lipid II flippase MurJ [Alphaproteobacteria bacterium]